MDMTNTQKKLYHIIEKKPSNMPIVGLLKEILDIMTSPISAEIVLTLLLKSYMRAVMS